MGGLLFRRPPLFSPGQAQVRSEMQLSLGMAPRAIANFPVWDSLEGTGSEAVSHNYAGLPKQFDIRGSRCVYFRWLPKTHSIFIFPRKCDNTQVHFRSAHETSSRESSALHTGAQRHCNGAGVSCRSE